MTLHSYLMRHRKIYLNWIINLNVRITCIKLVEENTGENLCDLWLNSGIFTRAQKTIDNKEKNNKLDLKIKIICFLKDIVMRIKGQATGWE